MTGAPGEPPPYPRIPHLWPAAGATAGDRVVPADARQAWLEQPVVVEEKLDGANVSVSWDGTRPLVASRGGVDARDRAGQLGPLRARVYAAVDGFRRQLEGGGVLYGEWLWLTHTVYYDRLPDVLVGLDVLDPTRGFVGLPERNDRCAAMGLAVPPLVFEGVLGSAEALSALFGPSGFGDVPMEGVVLRQADGRRCKVLAPGFRRARDEGIGTRRNVVAPR